MARPPRIVIPGQPMHLIQRGNNRCPVFGDDWDRHFFLTCMREGCDVCGCDVHAYVLMTNHVHALLSPRAEDGPARLMQFLGSRYAVYFNRRYERVGTLWQGRYRASIIDTEAYFLTCARYVELNPVRAGIVPHPAAYRWSSYAHNALGQRDPLVRPHPLIDSLGATAAERRAAYAALFDNPLNETSLATIRDSANRGLALGDESFRRHIASLARRRRR
jgi:putative transposase